MKVVVPVVLAVFAFGTARVARTTLVAERRAQAETRPFVPSSTAAPFVSLGYREMFSDLLFVRLRGYFGGDQSTPTGIAELCEAIVALDPRFHRTYEYCAHAMTVSWKQMDNDIYLRALALLDRGMREFPADWRLPYLAGQIYTQDLVTDDPAQRRDWDERGTLLIESAIRKPGAPASAAAYAAIMRTKFGQHQRAVEGLREVLLLTTDAKARQALIERLAELEQRDAEEIAGELYEARRVLNAAWQRDRPMLPFTWYVLLGARLPASFDLGALAMGDRELAIDLASERLEPLEDPAQDRDHEPSRDPAD